MPKILVSLRVIFVLFLFFFLSVAQGDVLCYLYRHFIDASPEPVHWLLGGAAAAILILIMWPLSTD